MLGIRIRIIENNVVLSYNKYDGNTKWINTGEIL
jgi:hypothetical protein